MFFEANALKRIYPQTERQSNSNNIIDMRYHIYGGFHFSAKFQSEKVKDTLTLPGN